MILETAPVVIILPCTVGPANECGFCGVGRAWRAESSLDIFSETPRSRFLIRLPFTVLSRKNWPGSQEGRSILENAFTTNPKWFLQSLGISEQTANILSISLDETFCGDSMNNFDLVYLRLWRLLFCEPASPNFEPRASFCEPRKILAKNSKTGIMPKHAWYLFNN